MKIMIGMHHPKHYWMFRNLIIEGQKRGWLFKVLISKKDVLEKLLIEDNVPYEVIGTNQPFILNKIKVMNEWIIQTIRLAKSFKPDIYVARALPHFSYASLLQQKPYILYEDSEPVKWLHRLTLPFADVIITPNCFKKDLGERHLKLNTYLELSYLHPNHFEPNEKIVRNYGLERDDKYALLRFVAWKAHHDIGMGGLTRNMKRKIIDTLLEHNLKVLISSEAPIEDEFRQHQIIIPPKHIHHFLAYATLFIGDSQTMTTEAALLGTPSIRSNTFVGDNDMGNFIELEHDYNLIFSVHDPLEIIRLITELMGRENLKDLWHEKVSNMLGEKIDLNSFNIWFLEHYPESLKMIEDGRGYPGEG